MDEEMKRGIEKRFYQISALPNYLKLTKARCLFHCHERLMAIPAVGFL